MPDSVLYRNYSWEAFSGRDGVSALITFRATTLRVVAGMVSDHAHPVQRVSRYCSAESMGAAMVHKAHSVPQMTRVAAGLQKAIPTAAK
jgi:hypothetical protein